MSLNIAVMASGSGTNFQQLVVSCAQGSIDGAVSLLIYDKEQAYVRERAQQFGIHAEYVNKRDFSNRDETLRDRYIADLLRTHGIDLVVLAGYLPLVGAPMIDAYANRIINLHPSLIPAFCGKGFYGHRVHEAVIEYGARVSGATVHFVDLGTDTGPIILQESVTVEYEDTPDSLAAKVSEIEHRLLPEAVRLFCAGKLEVRGRRVKILP